MGLEFNYNGETSSPEEEASSPEEGTRDDEVALTLCDSNSQVNDVLSRGLGGIGDLVCGYRFTPNGLVLMIYYLLPMIIGVQLPCNIIQWIDLYACDLNQLPLNVIRDFRENEFYCFTRVEKRYSAGAKLIRGANNGYWKQSGEDKVIFYNKNQIVGFRKTLVFYWENPDHSGKKSNLSMHEYRMHPNFVPVASQNQIIKDELESCVALMAIDDWNNSPSQKNGA